MASEVPLPTLGIRFKFTFKDGSVDFWLVMKDSKYVLRVPSAIVITTDAMMIAISIQARCNWPARLRFSILDDTYQQISEVPPVPFARGKNWTFTRFE